MKYSTAVVALLSALVVPSSALWTQNQSILDDDDLKIPGDSPLKLCKKDHNDDILTIDEVVLAPNPPQAGQDLIVTAKGTAHQDIEEGAYVKLTVKYGLIRLISTKADLCEQIKNVDLDCPIEEGKLEIEKLISLPGEIPPGKYTVMADVYSKDDDPITCLEATVVFSRGGLIDDLEL